MRQLPYERPAPYRDLLRLWHEDSQASVDGRCLTDRARRPAPNHNLRQPGGSERKAACDQTLVSAVRLRPPVRLLMKPPARRARPGTCYVLRSVTDHTGRIAPGCSAAAISSRTMDSAAMRRSRELAGDQAENGKGVGFGGDAGFEEVIEIQRVVAGAGAHGASMNGYQYVFQARRRDRNSRPGRSGCPKVNFRSSNTNRQVCRITLMPFGSRLFSHPLSGLLVT
jgi:hypothetical protein